MWPAESAEHEDDGIAEVAGAAGTRTASGASGVPLPTICTAQPYVPVGWVPNRRTVALCPDLAVGETPEK